MFRKLSSTLAACAALSVVAVLSPFGWASAQGLTAGSGAADATPQQIYDMARAGDVSRAQQMIEQVLRDHPNSAKAHYVAAKVYARSGNLSRGRSELSEAQSLSPGLSFAAPGAVQELQQQLSGRRILYGTPLVRQSHGISWGAVLLLVGVGAVIFALLRRRTVATQYAQPYGAPPYGGYGQPYPPSPYGPYPGGGSGLMGGLATGLAVGAGVAAGEALTQHMLGGGSNGVRGEFVPNADAAELPTNTDMGGNDFGINDGSSWDGGGGGDPFGGDGGGDMGGGGDWT